MAKPLMLALVCAPLLTCPVPAFAKHAPHASNPTITVEARSETRNQWSSRVGQSLNDGLEYPRPIGRGDYNKGMTKVSFRCTEQGRAGTIAVLKTSGSADLDRAAMTAVSRIATLHPLPDGVKASGAFEAWVMFSPDDRSSRKMLGDMKRQAFALNSAISRPDDDAQTASLPVVLLASR